MNRQGSNPIAKALRRGGFTLVEVLVALVIVTVGMAAVLGALSSSGGTMIYLRDKTFAQWVALNQLANLRLAGGQPPLGTKTGDTDYAGRSWHWRQDIATTQIAGVERIDIKVRPAEVKGDDDSGWFTTVSGVWGNAVGAPNGFQPDWGVQIPKGATTAPGSPNQGASAAVGPPGGAALPAMPLPALPLPPPDNPPDNPPDTTQ